MNTQDWSPLGWTVWISLLSKPLSRIFSHTTVQKHQFFIAQLCQSPAPAARESTWRDEPCQRRMMEPLTQGAGLHVYFKLQVLFYTLTKALGQRSGHFKFPFTQIYCLHKTLLPFKQSFCFSDSLRIGFTIYYLLLLMCPILNLWLHCNSCLCLGCIPHPSVYFLSFLLGSVVQNSRKRRKSLGKWRRARSTQLCTTDRKTSPAFSYAWRQELIINRDVTCESRLWEKPMSHLDRTVLEMFLLIMC